MHLRVSERARARATGRYVVLTCAGSPPRKIRKFSRFSREDFPRFAPLIRARSFPPDRRARLINQNPGARLTRFIASRVLPGIRIADGIADRMNNRRITEASAAKLL